MGKARVTEKNREQILHGTMWKAILALAIPVIINSFLQTMYNLTDTYWLGQLGTEELAAINLVTPVQQIAVNFGAGITSAGAVLIAQLIGAGKEREAGTMAAHIFLCAMGFSVCCALLLCIGTPGIVSWLGAEGETWRCAKEYLQLVILDMPFLYLVNIYAGVHQAQGDTVHPMFLNLGGITINMLLDPLLMLVFRLGVQGAALATIGAKAIPAVIALCLLLRKDQAVRLELSGFHFEKEKLKSIVRIGLPTAVGGSTMQFGFLLMSRNVLVYGTQAVAAYGIGNKVNGLISLPSNGIGSAVATIVGQNAGAGQMKRAERGFQLSAAMAVSFLLVGGVILSRPVISEAIVRIFSQDEEVVAMAAEFLGILALYCFTNGVYNSAMGLFQGTGHTEVTMLVDASRLWIFRFAVLYICEHWLHLGVASIWYCVVVSNALSALTLLLLYRTRLWEKTRS